MNQIEQDIKIVGMSIITSNEAALNQYTIGKLWDNFLKTPIKEKLTNIASSSIFAVYTDYDDGYEGNYRITIGFAVNHIDKIPDGLTAVTIPAGKYKTFQAKSQAPEDIINTWKIIWQIDSNIFKPNFETNFEEYKESGEVIINMGYK